MQRWLDTRVDQVAPGPVLRTSTDAMRSMFAEISQLESEISDLRAALHERGV